MELSFKECPLADWQRQAQKIKSAAMAPQVELNQNIFASIQFVGDELDKIRPRAYSLLLNETPVAWCMVYFLSSRVIRLRGLYVDEAYRNKKYMTALLENIFKLYQDQADRVLSFATPNALGFHEKLGFKKVEKFIPRPVEHYDPVSKKYSSDSNELITLYQKSLR